MSLVALTCPHCGAPLPARAKRAAVECAYCHRAVTQEAEVVRVAEYRNALAALDDTWKAQGLVPLFVAGVPYRVLGRIAIGHSSDVVLAEPARRIGERVVLKVLRALSDVDLLDHEWNALISLSQSDAPGALHFAARLPALVARGRIEDRPFMALRYSSGFAHTLEDVRAHYPAGVDARHIVWMWRRLLELLGWVHHSGWTHGAVLPAHILVHARDHGVMLAGWSCAARIGERLRTVSEQDASLYPESVVNGAPVGPEFDLILCARALRTLGAHLPPPLDALFAACAAGQPPMSDAWALERQVASAARVAYGAPKYIPFSMPGWASIPHNQV